MNDTQRKRVNLNVRVTADQRDELKLRADKAGMTLTEYLLKGKLPKRLRDA